eukprot:Tamp_24759.p1 GENE.Tamp_24759~~Tamp_24759.p1  ORF type:complete len:313 (+),score=49.43 Tamp_24759:2-940(+)
MAGGATDMHLCAALPVAALATILVTIAASCSLAISAQHIPPWPQISMCGMYPPERYVFSMGFTVGAGLLAMLLVINHVRNDHLRPARSQWSAEAHLGVGLSSTLCLALMATVPVSEFPVPHVLFAVFFFLLVLVFQAINSVGRVRSLMGEYARLSGGEKLASAAKEAWMLFWMAACFIGFALWQLSGSTGAQYVAVAAVMLHFAPYIWEFQDSSVLVKVELSGNDAERAEVVTRLLDVENGTDRSPRRIGMLVPAMVVLAVCLLLAFLLGHLTLDAQGQKMQARVSPGAGRQGFAHGAPAMTLGSLPRAHPA